MERGRNESRNSCGQLQELGGHKVRMSFVKMRLGRLIGGAREAIKYLEPGQAGLPGMASCHEKQHQVGLNIGGVLYGAKSEDPFYSPSHGGLSRRKSHTLTWKGCQVPRERKR
ncbi:hypothetical protein PspLS_11513 [Pyricularia sp. CBS 133598]|nr:hypothetical protein PspLS_11513 [Pyricularia sp. CBS 133598]